jgi:threonine dehydratase
MIPPEWIDQAEARIGLHIRHTQLSQDARLHSHLKWESQQVTGSFKVRGAVNKVLALSEPDRQAGLVTASAGNHGQGLALAARITGASATVFTPELTASDKVEAMKRLGAWVMPVAGSYSKAEQVAQRYARDHQMTWVSAYNDAQVIAGQGTVALEILSDLSDDETQTWVVPVGGGGLLSGVGIALEARHVHASLLGVNSAASPFMDSLYHRGTQEGVADLPTLAEGLAGAVEQGSLTIPLVRRYAADILTVTEEEIAQAISYAWHVHHQRLEGSGAAGLAAVLGGQVKKKAVVVLTGGNIQNEIFVRICSQQDEHNEV